MNGVEGTLLGIAVAILLIGAVFRRFCSEALPTVSDEEFVRSYYARHPGNASPAAILSERKRVGDVLGIAQERLSPEQYVDMLAARFSYPAEFSVAWIDLAGDAAEARTARGLPPRQSPPRTIGDMIEDRLPGAP